MYLCFRWGTTADERKLRCRQQ